MLNNNKIVKLIIYTILSSENIYEMSIYKIVGLIHVVDFDV